ncbi:MAG TPA: hypothetical protein VL500_07100 [Candidatus Eisenbacteria bacterium]|nr:hypothetical protein [Candidatus Eisenbacteria bacterium]
MEKLADFYGQEFASRADLPLPEGYVPYRACPEYFRREAAVMPGMSLVGKEKAWGVGWRHGPFRFEKYVGDSEPGRDPSGPLRLVIWQRLTRGDVPPGWMAGPMDMGFRMTGFVEAENSSERSWSSHARRHASHWRKLVAAGEREIVELSLDDYLAAHAKADLDAYVKLSYPGLVRDKAAAHGARFRLIGSRRTGGPIDAGLAFLHVPEAGQSLHVAAFISGAAKQDSAATGLVLRWFEECRNEGIAIMDFGFFWAPGDPRDWKGFSMFKSRFGVRPLRYPRPLFRFAGKLQAPSFKLRA